MSSPERVRPQPPPLAEEARSGPGASAARGGLSPNATLILAAAVLVFLYLVRDILLPFVLAGIVAYVCTPLIDQFALRLRIPRWVPALAVLFVLMTLASLVGLVGVPAMAHEAVRVVGDLQGSIEGFVAALMGPRTVHLMGAAINAQSLAVYTVNAVHAWISTDTRIIDLTAWGIAAIFGLILAWVLLAYFLIDGPRVAKGLLWLVPPPQRPFMLRAWTELNPLLRRYFIGVALVVVYASVAAYIGLGLALGLHHAVFLAMLTGLLEMIPVVGPAAAAVIAGLVAVSHAASGWDILAYIAYAIALRVSIDQFFGPIVLGRAARVSPIVVIFCFLSGGVLFGVVGVVLAVPVALIIKVILAVRYGEPHTEPG
jgi:predicted PurR-regulated permease PerM